MDLVPRAHCEHSLGAQGARRGLRIYLPISWASGSACSRACFLGRNASPSSTTNATIELEFKDADAVTQSLGIGLVHFPVGSPADFEPAFNRMIEEKCDALYIVASTFANAHWEKLAQLALDYRLPAMYGFREFAYFDGLLSYGANLSDGWRRAAAFVDKNSQGIAAVGFAGRATDPLRASHRRENSQSAWRGRAPHAARAGRRGDRMKRRLRRA